MLHTVVHVQDEPKTCSSCRKKRPAAEYNTAASRTCAACSSSRKGTHALKRCSSCRKEKPAAEYDTALRTCAVCSSSRKESHALKRTAIPDAIGHAAAVAQPVQDPAQPTVVATTASVVATGKVKCSSCNRLHEYCGFKTCGRCLVTRKDKTLQRRTIKDAAKLEGRIGKKICGTKNWCWIDDFNEGAKICRTHQTKSRERRI